MKDKKLLRKWLDNSLSEEERAAFEQTEDYRFVSKLTEALQQFKAPDFPVEAELERHYAQKQHQPAARMRWLAPLLKVAAVLLLVGGFSYWFIAEEPSAGQPVQIAYVDQQHLSLPDASNVALNKQSNIEFNQSNWSENRRVRLRGEAYFEVEKGSRFDVVTDFGKVSVLGTRFNVKARKDYFEVTCYEGKVTVETKFSDRMKLSAGEQYRVINGQVQQQTTAGVSSPSWTKNMSTFTSVPVIQVLREFERQYEVTIRYDQMDTSRLFTGSFTHSDRSVALKSITIPLGLTYRIDQDNIILME